MLACEALSALDLNALSDKRAHREKYLNEKFGLKTTQSEVKGTCVNALRSFEPGEILLSTEPYAFVVNSDIAVSHCHNCLQNKKELRSCSGCKIARSHFFCDNVVPWFTFCRRYCGVECQKKSWSRWHRWECAVQGMIERELADLPFALADQARLIVRVLLCRGGDSKDQSKESYQVNFDDVSSMCEGPAAGGGDEAADRGLAQRVGRILARARSARPAPSDDEVVGLLRRFRANNFSVWDELILPLGQGVVPLGALLNHSCRPNAVLHYAPCSLRQTVRALRKIGAGEEVCHAYLDVAATTPKRRGALQAGYGFTCMCEECVAGPARDARLGDVDAALAHPAWLAATAAAAAAAEAEELRRAWQLMAGLHARWSFETPGLLGMVALASRRLQVTVVLATSKNN
mmetsp:Transcript_40331/g.108212  ORF Transcript_40331/g.108212 Transcript_40331/m.108212 type:complete len:404 (-) Transcript_40331:937-2148(-)